MTEIDISSNEIIDIIRLIRTKNIGPITFHKLIEQYGSPQKALQMLPQLTKKAKNPLQIYSKTQAEAEIELAFKNNIHIVPYNSPYYPPLLKTTEDYPPILFVKGHRSLLKKSSIAIVGSRNASIIGKNLAFEFAKELGDYNFLIVSGLAKGIDSAAHRGSINKGTVAFLGGGVDIIYPKESTEIYEELANYGALVSECGIGSAPIPSNFPKRNRLIAGMCRGILIVEAGLNSGSLITAQIALNLSREVFAIPGNPKDLKSSGTNHLIKEGATLTENVQDIINVLKNQINTINPLRENHPIFNDNIISSLNENELEKTRKILYQSLSSTPLDVDIIIRETKIKAIYINTVLLELDLLGYIERFPNNKVALIKNIP